MQKTFKNASLLRNIIRRNVELYKLISKNLGYGKIRWIGGIISGGLQVFSSFLFGNLTAIAIDGEFDTLINYSLTLLGCVIGNTIITYINSYTNDLFINNSKNELKKLVVKKAHELPIAFFEKRHTSEVISLVTNDIEKFIAVTGRVPGSLLSWMPAAFLISFISLTRINIELTLICSLTAPISIFIVNKLNKDLDKYSVVKQRYVSEYNSALSDLISGIDVFKAFNMKKRYKKKYLLAIKGYSELSHKITARRSITRSVALFGMIFPQIIALSIGSVLVKNGHLTVAELLVFSSVMWPYLNALKQASSSWPDVNESGGYSKKILEFFREYNERRDGVYVESAVQSFDVELKDVSFSYEKNISVLKSISMRIKENEKTAIVGVSGSGKTTVIKLLMGFYEDYEGQIFIGGAELSKWNLKDLRKRVAVVEQEINMFNKSVYDNIRFGKPLSTECEVINAAKKAYAHEFIMEMKNGYETILAENGRSLSGGQKQRISLARAFLKESPIILLDEPTSALDRISEQYVHEALANLGKEKTIIIVAHRLSTIETADNIIILDQGKVAGMGKHGELIRNNPQYISLFRNQIINKGGEI